MIIEEIIFLNGACSPKGNGLLFFAPNDLRLTIEDTLCSMRYALCCIKMAQDRLEECLQAVVGGKDPGTVER